MKKLFLAVLAVAALAACKKDVLVQQQDGTAIAFGSAFVDNVTRASDPTAVGDPSTTTHTIESMHVWGFMDKPSGYVFRGKEVTKDADGKWTYSPIQYWFPGHVYYFAAVSPYDDNKVKVEAASEDALKGLGTITFDNVDGNTDLLYSATTVSTVGKSVNDTYDPVAFTFNHLLSKIKFTFRNGFEAEANHFLKVTNIRMAAPKKGSINVAQSDWWSSNEWEIDQNGGTMVLKFGDVNKGESIHPNTSSRSDLMHFVIPTDDTVTYDVAFDVELWLNDVKAIRSTLRTTITGVAFEIGKAYNLKAEIGPENISPDGPLKPIEFSAEVKAWEYGPTPDEYHGNGTVIY